MNLIDNWLCKCINLWCWRDCVELTVIIICSYQVVAWLSRNRTKKLLLYFYTWAILLIFSYFLELPTLFYGAIWGFPVLAIAAVIMHQEMLQKNCITPYTVVPAISDYDWLDELMRSCLIAINLQRSFICAIQHNDDLQTLLTTPCKLKTQLNEILIRTILESKLFENNSIMWLSTHGEIIGINCTWVHALDPTDNNQSLSTWKMACMTSSKTDAMFFKINPEQNSFDLALHGNILNNVTSSNCLKILRQYLAASDSSTKKHTDVIGKDHHEKHCS